MNNHKKSNSNRNSTSNRTRITNPKQQKQLKY